MTAKPRAVAAGVPSSDEAWRTEVLVIARGIAADLAAIRAAFERGRPAVAITDVDAKLLAAIYAAVSDRVFCASELVTHAALPQSDDLRAALGKINARRLGKTLKRIEGCQAGGYEVVRVGEDRGGAVWKVRALAGVRE